MDDFSIYGDSFSQCLHHLELVNWEKCHFMVQHGIILGHEIFKKEIEADKVTIDVIAKLHVPKCVKAI